MIGLQRTEAYQGEIDHQVALMRLYDKERSSYHSNDKYLQLLIDDYKKKKAQ